MLATRTFKTVPGATVLFGLDASTRHLKEAIGAVVARDIYGDASVASDLVAFVAEVERFEWMKGVS